MSLPLRRHHGAFLVCTLWLFVTLVGSTGCAGDDPVAVPGDPGPGTEDPSDDPTDDSGDDPADDPADDPSDGRDPIPLPENLLPDTELTQGLFGWPEQPFGRGNNATIEIFRHTGDAAVDFTLRDDDGEEHRLAQLLRERPVLLIQGSFT